MCLSPRYITNRSLHFDLYKKVKMQVPCGKCEECKQVNRNEWFCRCYYEWMKNRQNDTYFYTLTYNNENLPVYMGVPHFSKRHIQLFLKRLRLALSDYDVKLKYMCCCEFGELRGRSHYHILFFLSRSINPYWFYKLVEQSWQYGFVKYGDNVGVVNSPAGIQYVTKYVTKDFSQLDQMLPLVVPKLVKRYSILLDYINTRSYGSKYYFALNYDDFYTIRFISDAPVGCEGVDELRKSVLRKVRGIVSNLVPFHLQSTKLGTSIKDFVVQDLEKVPVMNQRGNVHMYKLPRYIKRLLWYDVIEGENSHKNDTFVLNEEGIKHMFSRFETDIENTKLNVQSTLINACSDYNDYIHILNEQCKTMFKSWRDVVYWCQHFDLDLEVLSIYKNIFRGRVCTFDSDFSADYIKSNWKQYASACLNDCSCFDFGDISKSYQLQQQLTALMFNNHPYFLVYEQAVCILDCIEQFHRQFVSSAKVDIDKNVRKLRQYIQLNV